MSPYLRYIARSTTAERTIYTGSESRHQYFEAIVSRFAEIEPVDTNSEPLRLNETLPVDATLLASTRVGRLFRKCSKANQNMYS